MRRRRTDARPAAGIKWQRKIRELKREAAALAVAVRDPRTPASARWLTLLILAYLASPVDLIPDWIPLIGLLDDLILVPWAIRQVLTLIPADVMEDARRRVDQRPLARPVGRWLVALVILLIWAAGLYAIVGAMLRWQL